MVPHKRVGRACWPWNLTNTSQTCWTSVLASLVHLMVMMATSQTCWTSVLAMEPHKHLTNVLDERAGQSCTFNGDDGYLTNVLDERAGHGTSQTPHKRVGRACWPVLYI